MFGLVQGGNRQFSQNEADVRGVESRVACAVRDTEPPSEPCDTMVGSASTGVVSGVKMQWIGNMPAKK
jgi:hypothetical protein